MFRRRESYYAWPGQLRGEPIWVVRWPTAPLHVVELYSRLNLRQTHGFEDGARIEFEIALSSLVPVSLSDRVFWWLVWGGRKAWTYRPSYWSRVGWWASQLGCSQRFKTFHRRNWRAKLLEKAGARWSLIKRWERARGFLLRESGKRSFYSEEEDAADELSRTLRVVNFSKLSPESYSGRGFEAGYQTLRLHGQVFPGQRDPRARVELIPLDFEGLTVLDLGCNQGAMLLELASKLKYGVGVDYDPYKINAAHRLQLLEEHRNLGFYTLDFDTDPLPMLVDFLPEGQSYDVVFMLAVSIWIEKWRELILYCREISSTLVFEASGNPDQQDQREAFLRQSFGSVECLAERSLDDPSYQGRRLFICRKGSPATGA